MFVDIYMFFFRNFFGGGRGDEDFLVKMWFGVSGFSEFGLYILLIVGG